MNVSMVDEIQNLIDETTVSVTGENMTEFLRKLAQLYGAFEGVGLRTDPGTPEWITPTIMKGGFSAGKPAAGGEVSDWEKAFLLHHNIDIEKHDASVAQASATDAGAVAVGDYAAKVRLAINRWCLLPEGQAWLTKLLQTGEYRIDYTEEACLLVVCLLRMNNNIASAVDLISKVQGWFHVVRFYPRVASKPIESGCNVSVAMLGDIRQCISSRLARAEHNIPHSTAYRIHILNTQYLPLYQQVIGWSERYVESDKKELPSQEQLQLVKSSLSNQGLLKKSQRGNLYKIIQYLEDAIRYGDLFRATSYSSLKFLTQCAKEAWEQREWYIEQQPLQDTRPALKRLESTMSALVFNEEDNEEGVDEDTIADLMDVYRIARGYKSEEEEPWTMDELLDANCLHQDETTILHKLRRMTSGSVAELVEKDLVPSVDVLASIAVKYVNHCEANAYPSTETQRLAAALQNAFAKRRSRLLLSLRTQVGLTDIPWFVQLQSFKSQDTIHSGPSDSYVPPCVHDALVEIISLYFKRFPGCFMENTFVETIRYGYLNDTVKEVASDIFCWEFSRNYAKQCLLARNILGNTIYARYYNLDDEWKYITQVVPKAETIDGFAIEKIIHQHNAQLKQILRSKHGARTVSRKAEESKEASSRSRNTTRPCSSEEPVVDKSDIVHLSEDELNNVYKSSKTSRSAWGCARNPAQGGVVIERMMQATTHNMLLLLQFCGLDTDATFMSSFARTCLSEFVKSLSITESDYICLREEARRGSWNCLQFVLALGLLDRMSARQELESILVEIKQYASALHPIRAAPLLSIAQTIENKDSVCLRPFSGWVAKSPHHVFRSLKPEHLEILGTEPMIDFQVAQDVNLRSY